MKLIPILFSTPMVQAILSGNKSMTRRSKGLDEINENPKEWNYVGFNGFALFDEVGMIGSHFDIKCPYGQPGDVLWVRETFVPPLGYGTINSYLYKSRNDIPKTNSRHDIKWKPNIHMPFEACRIFLRVKGIRVERLQDISREDCKREGITLGIDNGAFSGWHDRFCDLWQSINGADSWNANPWVWVIAFERITNISEIVDIVELWNERRAK